MAAAEELTEGRVRSLIQEELNKKSPTTASRVYENIQETLTQTAVAVRNSFRGRGRAGPRATGRQRQPQHFVSSTSTWWDSVRGRVRSHSPGHPYRLNAKQASVNKSKSFNVWLLDGNGFNNESGESLSSSCVGDDVSFNEISFSDELVLLKGYATVNTEDSEYVIKKKLCDLFRLKISNINPDSFYYVKREINKLIYPQTSSNYTWDYKNLKLLTGQGKLYCCLKNSYLSHIKAEKVDEKIDEKVDEDVSLLTDNGEEKEVKEE